MDIGFAGKDNWWPDDAESSDVDVVPIGEGHHCYRCGGVGHIANECPTPKGKGKGKEDKGFNSKGSKGKGKSSSGKGFEKGKGKGRTLCGHFAVLDASSRRAPLEVHECCRGERPLPRRSLRQHRHECLQFGA